MQSFFLSWNLAGAFEKSGTSKLGEYMGYTMLMASVFW